MNRLSIVILLKNLEKLSYLYLIEIPFFYIHLHLITWFDNYLVRLRYFSNKSYSIKYVMLILEYYELYIFANQKTLK